MGVTRTGIGGFCRANGRCDRRSFLAGTILAPAAAVAAASREETRREPPKPATGVRVTVLKRTQELALQERYLKEGVIPACGTVRDGQKFLAQAPYSAAPKGMCTAAWGQMLEGVKFVDGGSVDRLVQCCTDGYRPVFFLLERIV
jgi:uncharacterized repeat protein (TIGR04076 family)